LRAIGAKYRHLWPAMMERPARLAAARHGNIRRKAEHPGRIPPCRSWPDTRNAGKQAPGIRGMS
jgi:hypothetical protein